ncbi:Outer membrane protein OmpA [Flaviramulus basaltis]|uniref:Outer membrane protein OmpA n=1 Tax=Flaviramulus basaltis TaxID=369401 RepID=A0A1K2IHK7_9FLAO|nr:Outer membrane protein OmpA [Flaviramulus basaltis]
MVFVFAYFSSINAQIPPLTEKDSTIVSSWIFGIGYNIIDDSGDVFDKLFDIKKSWNALPYPSRISIGKYFKNGLGVEAIAAYTKYSKGKRVDRMNITENEEFLSFDTRLSYDLNKVIGETGWFDPYIGLGLGYTDANNVSRGTFNGVLGFRTWFSDNLGLDINSSGKWSFDATATNYIQHVVGVVYRFDIKKELTKQGEEKLALINELEKENIRFNDSIAMVAEVKEKAIQLENQLAQEKEVARLAQIEKQKLEEKNKKFDEIQTAINALDKVNFNFNSSNLNTESKKILLKLVSILNNNPELIVEISSHTDSRGSKLYNQILSEQRLKSTIQYLSENKVSNDKLIGKAFGEEKLLNECDDNTKCSESKHKENRRSEIKIIDFKN